MKKFYSIIFAMAALGLLFSSCQDATQTDTDDTNSNAQTVADAGEIYSLPDLPYEYDALEPHIDERTMRIHHSRHHQGYINNFNNEIAGTPLENMSMEEIFSNMSEHSTSARNNGGGHYNHKLFWSILSPNGGGEPTGELAASIDESFGTFQNFKTELENAGATQFGSGWAWLIVNNAGDLLVTQTPNQDNPLMDVAKVQGTPILGVDVWEHAYYLHYQNRRGAYLEAFWNVVDWDAVSARYMAATQ